MPRRSPSRRCTWRPETRVRGERFGTLNPRQDLVDRVRVDLGLDQPLATQYGQLLGRLVTGDLGESYQLHRPVAEVISSEIGWTAQLAVASLVLALVPSVLLAVATAG